MQFFDISGNTVLEIV